MMVFVLAFNLTAEFNLVVDESLRPYIEVFYSFPLSALTFEKEENYVARYRISLTIYKGKEQVGGMVRERRIEAEDYESTVRDTLVEGKLVHSIKEGEYTVRVTVWDMHSQRKGEVKKKIKVKIPRDFYLSSLRWRGKKKVGIRDTVRVEFDLLSRKRERIEWKITSEDGKLIKNGEGEIVAPVSGYTLVIPLDSLPEGKYTISVKCKDQERKREFEIEYPFFSSKRFLERADEMIYIAPRGFIEEMKRASPEERERMWKEFWKEKDPSPGTEKNEAEEEYFRRVDYANKHFGSPFMPGWKTDMGRVYIKLGEPDEIERHPFELDKPPYEIWYYYSKGITCIFVDKHNIGHYVLVSPRGL
ncbi:hypothetical protein DRQ16_02940 [bacterium]|nr:MAG: hypothetical protein DRQ16_02940 [bacterium]